MDNLIATLIPFIGGLIVGGLLVWLLWPARRNLGRLEDEKAKAEKALADYKHKVDHHFMRTAERIDELTAAYRAVHEELADGAQALCSEESRRKVMDKSLASLSSKEDSLPLQRPLDYAPKSQGTLSEGYGLDKDAARATAPRDYAEGCTDQGCSTVEDSKEAKS